MKNPIQILWNKTNTVIDHHLKKILLVSVILLMFAQGVLAEPIPQGPTNQTNTSNVVSTSDIASTITLKVQQWSCKVVLLIQGIVIVISAIMLTLLAIRLGAYRNDPMVRNESKQKAIQIFTGLLIISVSINLVNYLVSGHMDPFTCALGHVPGLASVNVLGISLSSNTTYVGMEWPIEVTCTSDVAGVDCIGVRMVNKINNNIYAPCPNKGSWDMEKKEISFNCTVPSEAGNYNVECYVQTERCNFGDSPNAIESLRVYTGIEEFGREVGCDPQNHSDKGACFYLLRARNISQR